MKHAQLIEETYSPEVIGKARALIEENQVRQDEDHPVVWWVTPRHGVTYRVQVIEDRNGQVWVTCTCANGNNVGNRPRCYHSCAVLASIEEDDA